MAVLEDDLRMYYRERVGSGRGNDHPHSLGTHRERRWCSG